MYGCRHESQVQGTFIIIPPCLVPYFRNLLQHFLFQYVFRTSPWLNSAFHISLLMKLHITIWSWACLNWFKLFLFRILSNCSNTTYIDSFQMKCTNPHSVVVLFSKCANTCIFFLQTNRFRIKKVPLDLIFHVLDFTLQRGAYFLQVSPFHKEFLKSLFTLSYLHVKLFNFSSLSRKSILGISCVKNQVGWTNVGLVHWNSLKNWSLALLQARSEHRHQPTLNILHSLGWMIL